MSSYQKITRASRWLDRLCLLSIVLLPFYLAHHWLLPREFWLDGMPFATSIMNFESWPPPPQKQLLGIVISFLPGLLIAKILWHLRTLFNCYSRGIFFSEETIVLCGKSASAVLWLAIVWIVSQSLMSVAMSFDTSSPILTVTFTHAHVLALFAAVMMRVITWIMSAGQDLATENQSFV